MILASILASGPAVGEGNGEILFTLRTWQGDYETAAASGASLTAFESDLWAARPDGTGLRQVTRLGKGTGAGCWSPKHEWIYFQSNLTGDYEVYRCRPDGSGVENLTRSPDTEDYGRHLSPDGAQFVYTKHRPGEPGQVAVMQADGSSQRVVVTGSYSYMGRFLPGSSAIVYVSLRPNYGVYRRDLASGDEQCLRREEGVDLHNPIPSPDGRYVLCFRRAGGVSDIWRLDANGANAVPLTEGNTHESFHLGPKDLHGGSDPPAWSPDGRRIAFVTGDPAQVWTMAADGSDKRQVCRTDGPCGYAEWLPGGRRIVFVSWVGDYPQLFIAPAEGGAPRQLTDLPGAVLWPVG
jgi:Tol biopolymer transport system component